MVEETLPFDKSVDGCSQEVELLLDKTCWELAFIGIPLDGHKTVK